jgi:uncharacterized short protein YbdD (DUF466 family)
MKIVKNWSRNTWSWIRQVSGDAAYENYLRSTRRIAQEEAEMARVESRIVQAGCCSTHATPTEPLTRSEFYLDALRRRYSTISRCC